MYNDSYLQHHGILGQKWVYEDINDTVKTNKQIKKYNKLYNDNIFTF